MKNKPVVINRTTYLPVREVPQAVGYNVTFNKGKYNA
ncbi:stalk domain-containing protein [Paenibacillus lautus]